MEDQAPRILARGARARRIPRRPSHLPAGIGEDGIEGGIEAAAGPKGLEEHGVPRLKARGQGLELGRPDDAWSAGYANLEGNARGTEVGQGLEDLLAGAGDCRARRGHRPPRRS